MPNNMNRELANLNFIFLFTAIFSVYLKKILSSSFLFAIIFFINARKNLTVKQSDESENPMSNSCNSLIDFTDFFIWSFEWIVTFLVKFTRSAEMNGWFWKKTANQMALTIMNRSKEFNKNAKENKNIT